jgi:hypothetical protein
MAKTLEGLFEGSTVDLDSLDFTFDTWYTDDMYTTPYNFDTPVTETLNLYANWTNTSSPPVPVDVSGQTGTHVLAKALSYIATQAPSVTTNYTIVLGGGAYTLSGIANSPQANIKTENAVITLVGKAPTEISLSSNGRLFFITAGNLILGNHITLKGRASNNGALVRADGSSAFLTMKAGAKITGNYVSSATQGGGVYVTNNASFTMEGGEISHNEVSTYGGGGVYVDNASFTMEDGEISHNEATYGGGVYVDVNGSFIMEDGKISDNTVDSWGAGVRVSGSSTNSNNRASFTMNGGEISDNTATISNGGGVYVTYGSFTMTNGKISGNTATTVALSANGGGVYVQGNGTSFMGIFTMSGGEISGNTVSNGGGGVCVSGGANFTMSGGKIFGNTAYTIAPAFDGGGGVFVSGDASFSKTGGGVIYGDDDNDPENGDATDNTAVSGDTYGHAVYYASGVYNHWYTYYRDADLEEGDDIDTDIDTLPTNPGEENAAGNWIWIKR